MSCSVSKAQLLSPFQQHYDLCVCGLWVWMRVFEASNWLLFGIFATGHDE